MEDRCRELFAVEEDRLTGGPKTGAAMSTQYFEKAVEGSGSLLSRIRGMDLQTALGGTDGV